MELKMDLRRSILGVTILLMTIPTVAGPVVVPTAEGQMGEIPGPNISIQGPIRGQVTRPGFPDGQRFGNSVIDIDSVGGTRRFRFLSDLFHGTTNPIVLGEQPTPFNYVDMATPRTAQSRNTLTGEDYYAFSYKTDGTLPQTASVNLLVLDENLDERFNPELATNIETFAFPDLLFSRTGVAVDDQGRSTVVFTEFGLGFPSVKGIRIDSNTGSVIDPSFLIVGNIHANPDAALLDPGGNRLVVASNQFTNPPTIMGNIVDFSGPSPAIGPAFGVNNTVATFGDELSALASNPATGEFTAVWEHLEDLPGNPVDVRARRFDADGNPLGSDFVVNTSTANAQAQAAVAYGPQNISAIAWAGDSLTPQGPGDLDVFLQVYDATGNPIGGEVQVNTFVEDVQDQPSVTFLPNLDDMGRPQVMVTWRDVANSAGANPRGTGISYRCFSIEGLSDPSAIFEDGFESGDTSSWSDASP